MRVEVVLAPERVEDGARVLVLDCDSVARLRSAATDAAAVIGLAFVRGGVTVLVVKWSEFQFYRVVEDQAERAEVLVGAVLPFINPHEHDEVRTALVEVLTKEEAGG